MPKAGIGKYLTPRAPAQKREGSIEKSYRKDRGIRRNNCPAKENSTHLALAEVGVSRPPLRTLKPAVSVEKEIALLRLKRLPLRLTKIFVQ